MRSISVVASVIAGFVVAGAYSLCASAAERHVPGQYPTIQAAINASADGDHVIVAPGTYRERIDYLGKSITVRSSGGAQVTTIDARNAGRAVTIADGNGLQALRGFRITNGAAESGAGAFIEDVAHIRIEDCKFINNNASDEGGAIMVSGFAEEPIRILRCIFDGNIATGAGGAIHNRYSAMLIDSCDFTDNMAVSGGAIAAGDFGYDIVINSSRFIGNSASGSGGAISVFVETDVTLNDCIIAHNSAQASGGGFDTGYETFITMNRCVIAANTAQRSGGGIYSWAIALDLHDCLITANQAGGGGGGLYWADGFANIINTTLVGNAATTGGGIAGTSIFYDDVSRIANSVLWGNRATSGPQLALTSPDPYARVDVITIRYSLFERGRDDVYVETDGWDFTWGPGNIADDPRFRDPDGADDDPETWADNDFHTICGSPAIDAGDNDAVLSEIDLDLRPRRVDDPETVDTGNGPPPVVDMGCYEYQISEAPAVLTDLTLLDGTIVSGGLNDLETCDDEYLITEARVTGEAHQPHLLRMKIGAETDLPAAAEMDITIEGRISDVEAQTMLLLRDWNGNQLVPVDQYAMGSREAARTTTIAGAGRFVRQSDGRIELRVRQIVFLPFTLNGFHTFLDQVRVVVR